MRLIKKDKDYLELQIEDKEDLWYLTKLISKDDIVKGKSTRKIKVNEKNVEKKTYYFIIKVEKVEYQNEILKVNGTIQNEIEDIPKGSYQSINFKEGDIIKIEKKLNVYHEKILKTILEKNKKTFLIILFDREKANFFEVTNTSMKKILELHGEVEKKQYKTQKENFYKKIVLKAEEKETQKKYDKIIFSSPQFYQEYLKKELENSSIKEKSYIITVSGTEKNSVKELLERKEVQQQILQLKNMKETKIVEELLKNISKGEKYSYGFKDVKKALEYNAVETLIISTDYIDKLLEKNEFEKLNELLELYGKNINLEIIESEEKNKINSLGGIAAILRYNIE